MAKKISLLKHQLADGLVEPEYLDRLYAHSTNNIIHHLSTKTKIIDIGCYTGRILSMIKQKGYQNVLGLDPSDFAAKIAKEKNGIDVVVGSLFDDLEIGRFDFVILTHVLEHIVDLRAFITRIHDLLRAGGKIYVEVPDAHNFFLTTDTSDRFQAEHKDPFFQFSVEHVNYFTKISLHNLMTQMGFKMVVLESQVSTIAILASVWQKPEVAKDDKIEECLTTYIAESKNIFGNVLSIIDQVVLSGREILVWGAGLHTQKLLSSSDLMKANITAYVDSDPGYHNGTLAGKPIISPEKVRALSQLPILISSQLYQDEILSQIKNSGFKNEVILLYPSQTQ